MRDADAAGHISQCQHSTRLKQALIGHQVGTRHKVKRTRATPDVRAIRAAVLKQRREKNLNGARSTIHIGKERLASTGSGDSLSQRGLEISLRVIQTGNYPDGWFDGHADNNRPHIVCLALEDHTSKHAAKHRQREALQQGI
ncbi:MAG: hypothetical protein BWY63_01086 [Chloroflexi bacterium ADurb.Bin360]|nr:MAG: hypothetical protein BWY63_01086 [Chloroflexi bacterium ADurb.Bin360]